MNDAVVANSFNAHRLIHFATKHNKGDVAKKALHKAYLTEGKNIDDNNVLVELSSQIGLDEEESRKVLESDQYTNDVNQDIKAAKNMSIRGVPFFLFDRKYAVSGAQQTEVFLKALKKSWREWKENQSPVELSAENGEAYGLDGSC